MSGKPITNVRVTDISDPCGGRIKRAAEWCSENDGIEASYVYKASLMGRSPTLFLSDAEGPICIAEASPYNSRSEKLYEIALTEEESAQKEYELEGEFTFLCGEWAGNFWHWFTEFLPYVVYLEGRGYKGKYLVWNYAPLFIESLAWFGVGPDRIVPYDWRPVRVEKILVLRRHTGQNIECVAPLVRLVSAHLQALVLAPGYDDRLYIARRNSRTILNEERFLAEIQPYGFRKIYMEDLPLLDQIRTAAEAECIIGPHGAGMTASMFMKPRGRVIEIFASAYINPCVLGVCASLGHDYALVVNRQWTNPYPHGDAVFVEMDTLRAALKPLSKR